MVKNTNMNKKTGLAAFANKKITTKELAEEDNKMSNEDNSMVRKRGKGDTVALTIRLSRGDWERVHQLAVSEGVSIQRLAVEGLSKIFQEHGLSKLS